MFSMMASPKVRTKLQSKLGRTNRQRLKSSV